MDNRDERVEQGIDLFSEPNEETLDLFSEPNEETLDLFSSSENEIDLFKDLVIEDKTKKDYSANLEDLENEELYEIDLFAEEVEESTSLANVDSKKLTIKQIEKLTIDSANSMITYNTKAIDAINQSVQTELIVKIDSLINGDLFNKTRLEMREFFDRLRKPELTNKDWAMDNALEVEKNLLREDDLTLEASRDILGEKVLGLSKSDIEQPLNVIAFHKLRLAIIERDSINRREKDRLESMNLSYQKEFFEDLFKSQPSLFDDRITENDKVMLFNKIYVSTDRDTRTEFECSNKTCEAKNFIDEDLITFLRIYTTTGAGDDVQTFMSVVRCKECGTVHVLPKAGINALRISCRDKIRDSVKEKGKTEYGSYLMYTPGAEELAEKMPDVFIISEAKKEVSEEFTYNWETMCRDFYQMDNLFYSLNDDSFNSNIGIRNIAKILANQKTGYRDSKEKALATLLHALDNSGLEVLSHSYAISLIAPVAYESRSKEFSNDIARVLESKSFDEESGEVKDFDLFNKDYSKYCDKAREYPEKRSKLIRDLNTYKYLLSNIAISNFSLSSATDLINNYFRDPKLVEVIDLISDMMIISNYAEGFIDDFKPRKTGKRGKSVKDTKFSSKVKELNNDNSKHDLEEKVISFISYFVGDVKKRVGEFDIRNYISSFTQDEDFFILISKLAKSMLDRDYYEATKCKNQLKAEYGSLIETLGAFERFYPISKFINNLPVLNVEGKSKFEVYFPELKDLSEDDKFKIINIFSKVKLIPKTLVGEDINSKIEYYKNLDSNDRPSLKDYSEFDKYLEDNMVLCIGLSHFDSEIGPNDITKFNVSRDMFFDMRSCTLSELCNAFFLNEDLIKISINEKFINPKASVSLCDDITYLYFKNDSIGEVINNSGYSLQEKRGFLSAYDDELLSDTEGLSLSNELIESLGYFNTCNNLPREIVEDFLNINSTIEEDDLVEREDSDFSFNRSGEFS